MIRAAVAGSEIWSKFWREFGLEHEPNERCYIPAEARDTVDRHWARFAQSLPLGADVVDLGCGAGIAGRMLLDCRNDVHVTGVDWADVPPAILTGITIRSQVRMEALPFESGRFDAAISLFGIEYGDIERTSRELGRVLKPGARFSFLIHHSGSETLREGGSRRRALQELLAGKMKDAFLAGITSGIEQQRQRLRDRFPNEPMVDIVSNYLRRTIGLPRPERQATWRKLATDLDPEVQLLLHLERSAKSAMGIGAWLASPITVMELVNVSVLRRPCGEPIAWNIGGIR